MTISGARNPSGQASGLPATGKMPCPTPQWACKNPRKNANHVQAATRFWFDLIEKNCYAEAMFPRRHRAGGSVYHPAHNLAEEWKASGFLGPRLSCASRAVAAVRIGLILMVVGFRAVAQEDPQRFLFVKTWVGTFTRSFQNSGDGTTSDGCALLWNY